ncbi:MAG: GTP-binding protein, partial [Eubacteriales bacterium]|nr:GTP-binding protein [Eubacteriales bacterium]
CYEHEDGHDTCCHDDDDDENECHHHHDIADESYEDSEKEALHKHHHDCHEKAEHEHHHHHHDEEGHHHHHHDGEECDDPECECHHHHDDEDEHEHHHHHHHDGEECDDPECSCHHHHHHGHDAHEVFDSIGETGLPSITRDKLEGILDKLANTDEYGVILRAKGMLKAADADTWYHFDLTPSQFEVREGSADVSGKACVIGSNLRKAEIKELFK